MFLLHIFFSLKEKISTKETIEQQLQSIFFHPATLNETQTAAGVVFADTVFGYLVVQTVQVKHSHGITFVPSHVASLHLV